MKKIRLNLSLYMLLLAAFLWLALVVGWLQPIEQRLYDLRARFAADCIEPDPNIVVVAIDDDSLQSLQDEWGRWPWPRNAMAQVLDYLSEAKVVALDILYAEQDSEEALADAALVHAVRSHGLTLLATYQAAKDSALLEPFPDLRAAGAGLGHVLYQADRDGVVRRHRLQVRFEGAIVPSLALIGAQQMKADFQLPNDEFLIRWSRQSHQVVPIRELLESPVLPKDFFREKLVWIGSTATGVDADRQDTSLRVFVPGVEILAMASDNLLHGERYRNLSSGSQALLLVGLILLATCMVRTGPFSTLAFFVSCVGAYVGAAWWLARWGWMLPIVVPVGTMGLGGSLAGFQCWRREQVCRQALEDLEDAKQNFTDMLVHDMKNQVQPLTISLELLQSVELDSAYDRTTRERLARASRGAARLLDQLDQLLAIRQIQEATFPVQPGDCQLAEIVRRVLDEFSVAADKAHVILHARVPTGLQVYFDPNLLARVVGNLIWNAIQHAPSKSGVQVAAECSQDGTTCLTISNGGATVASDWLERVFEPFVSVAGMSRIDQKGGAGLGLAFCRLAVETHGGSIAMRSPRPGRSDGVSVEVHFGLDPNCTEQGLFTPTVENV